MIRVTTCVFKHNPSTYLMEKYVWFTWYVNINTIISYLLMMLFVLILCLSYSFFLSSIFSPFSPYLSVTTLPIPKYTYTHKCTKLCTTSTTFEKSIYLVNALNDKQNSMHLSVQWHSRDMFIQSKDWLYSLCHIPRCQWSQNITVTTKNVSLLQG